jgi:hypothetical protein
MAKTKETKARTSKRQRPATQQAGTRQAQDDMNRLYVAHQVHTLANVLFHHVSMAGQDAWSATRPTTAQGFGMPTPWNATPWPPAATRSVSQPLLYWYP